MIGNVSNIQNHYTNSKHTLTKKALLNYYVYAFASKLYPGKTR